MEENPSYYAIIPADVRYDKDLPPMAKLLYGEITCLTQKNGFCWATNAYFAELYGISKDRISKLIGILEKKGYISVHVEKNEKNVVVKRFIKLSEVKITIPNVKKNDTPIVKKIDTPIVKNNEENNTSKNNTRMNNTSKNILSHTDDFPEKPEPKKITQKKKRSSSKKNSENKETRNSCSNIIQTYTEQVDELINEHRLSEKPFNDYSIATKLIKNHLKNYSEEQIINAIKNAKNDNWIVSDRNFSFNTILSQKVLNNLVNKIYIKSDEVKINKGQSAFVDKNRDYENNEGGF